MNLTNEQNHEFLKEIHHELARYVKATHWVGVDPSMPWVSLIDKETHEVVVFLDGHEAQEFIDSAIYRLENCPLIDFKTACYAEAKSRVECLA